MPVGHFSGIQWVAPHNFSCAGVFVVHVCDISWDGGAAGDGTGRVHAVGRFVLLKSRNYHLPTRALTVCASLVCVLVTSFSNTYRLFLVLFDWEGHSCLSSTAGIIELSNRSSVSCVYSRRAYISLLCILSVSLLRKKFEFRVIIFFIFKNLNLFVEDGT